MYAASSTDAPCEAVVVGHDEDLEQGVGDALAQLIGAD